MASSCLHVVLSCIFQINPLFCFYVFTVYGLRFYNLDIERSTLSCCTVLMHFTAMTLLCSEGFDVLYEHVSLILTQPQSLSMTLLLAFFWPNT